MVKILKSPIKRPYRLIENALYVGRGINLRNKEKGEVDIYLTQRNTHLLGLGRTRWGKTKFISRASADDIEFGNSLFCIDPKGSYDWLETVSYVAWKVGRLKELMLFNPLYPEISVRVNPLAGMGPDKIGEVFFRLSPESKEVFFPQVAQETAETIATAFFAMGKTNISIWDIYSNSSPNAMMKLLEELKSYVPRTDGEKELYRRYYTDAQLRLEKIVNKDANFWSKVNTSFDVSVSQVATGDVGNLMGKVRENPLFEKLMRGEPVIFFAYLGVLEKGEMRGTLISRLLSSITHQVYGIYYTRNWTMTPHIAEYWDEASNVFYEGAQDKFNKAGGVGCYLHAFTQSLADPQKVIGKELTKVLLDNVNYVVFSIIDPETQRFFSQAFGETTRYEIFWKKDDFDLVQSRGPLVPPDHFARLGKGAFHAFIEAHYYRGYSPLLEVPSVYLYPLPFPVERIIAKKWGIDPRKAPPDVVAKAREISENLDLFLKENRKHRFADVIIDLKELEYYKLYVEKYYRVRVPEPVKKVEEELKKAVNGSKGETKVEHREIAEESKESKAQPTKEPENTSESEDVLNSFLGVENTTPNENEEVNCLKQLLEENKELVNTNRILIKEGILYVEERLLKKYCGDLTHYKKYRIRYNRIVAGRPIKTVMTACAVPLFKVGVELEEYPEGQLFEIIQEL